MSEILGGAWHLQGFAVTDKADMTFRHHRIIKELKFQQRRLTFFDTLTDEINDISNKHSRLFTHDFCIEDNEKANYIYFFCLRAFNILTEKYYLLMTDQRGQNPRYGYSEMRRRYLTAKNLSAIVSIQLMSGISAGCGIAQHSSPA